MTEPSVPLGRQESVCRLHRSSELYRTWDADLSQVVGRRRPALGRLIPPTGGDLIPPSSPPTSSPPSLSVMVRTSGSGRAEAEASGAGLS